MKTAAEAKQETDKQIANEIKDIVNKIDISIKRGEYSILWAKLSQATQIKLKDLGYEVKCYDDARAEDSYYTISWLTAR